MPIKSQQRNQRRKSRKLQRTCSLGRSIMERLWCSSLWSGRGLFQDDLPFKIFVNACRCTWRCNCDVGPNVSRVRDLSGCSETCRSLVASLSEQDGQWPAAGPLSRAQLQASSQTERKRRIPARTFKIHPIMSDSNEYRILIESTRTYAIHVEPSHFNVIIHTLYGGWYKWKSEGSGPEFLFWQSSQ